MEQTIRDEAPKRVQKDKRIFRLIHKCNDDLFLYESEDFGYRTTFSKFDLRMIEPPSEKPSYRAHRFN
jgi:hypothetical protein